MLRLTLPTFLFFIFLIQLIFAYLDVDTVNTSIHQIARIPTPTKVIEKEKVSEITVIKPNVTVVNQTINKTIVQPKETIVQKEKEYVWVENKTRIQELENEIEKLKEDLRNIVIVSMILGLALALESIFILLERKP